MARRARPPQAPGARPPPGARRWAPALAAGLALLGLVACAGGGGRPGPAAATPRLGQPLPAALAAADPTVFADGQGLPPGRGNAREGRVLYQARCAACHGAAGEGGPGGRLAGRGAPWPDRTIGQYWPHATTLFDYVRRAMPLDRPGTLSDDQAYALTAYLLQANGLLGEADELDAQRLPAVPLPNRGGFVRDAAVPRAP